MASGKWAGAPAPDCTATSTPDVARRPATSGTTATRRLARARLGGDGESHDGLSQHGRCLRTPLHAWWRRVRRRMTCEGGPWVVGARGDARARPSTGSVADPPRRLPSSACGAVQAGDAGRSFRSRRTAQARLEESQPPRRRSGRGPTGQCEGHPWLGRWPRRGRVPRTYGAAKKKPWATSAPNAWRMAHLLGGLHSLGDGAHGERVADMDDGLDDGPVHAFVGLEVGDEVLSILTVSMASWRRTRATTSSCPRRRRRGGRRDRQGPQVPAAMPSVIVRSVTSTLSRSGLGPTPPGRGHGRSALCWRSWTMEQLTASWMPDGHCCAWRQASASTQALRATMSSLASAQGMRMLGGMSPRSGWSHAPGPRTRADGPWPDRRRAGTRGRASPRARGELGVGHVPPSSCAGRLRHGRLAPDPSAPRRR